MASVSPPFDWTIADAQSWPGDRTGDAEWRRWFADNVSARVRRFSEAPDRDTANSMFEATLIPDLMSLAVLFSPLSGQTDALSNPDGSVQLLRFQGRA